jgi:hypothetical protein
LRPGCGEGQVSLLFQQQQSGSKCSPGSATGRVNSGQVATLDKTLARCHLGLQPRPIDSIEPYRPTDSPGVSWWGLVRETEGFILHSRLAMMAYLSPLADMVAWRCGLKYVNLKHFLPPLNPCQVCSVRDAAACIRPASVPGSATAWAVLQRPALLATKIATEGRGGEQPLGAADFDSKPSRHTPSVFCSSSHVIHTPLIGTPDLSRLRRQE